MRWKAWAAAIVALLAALPAWAECQLAKTGETSIEWRLNRPLAAVRLNGVEMRAIIDTGASVSWVFQDAANRLHLRLAPFEGVRVMGIGGAVPVLSARVTELSMGLFTVRNWAAPVIRFDWPGEEDIAMVLGQDVLSDRDIELNFGAGLIAFYRPQGDCRGRSLAYWNSAAQSVDMLPRSDEENSLRVAVTINGQEVRALIDSGAPTSLITRAAAARVGVVPDASAPARTTGGIGRDSYQTWLGAFDTFALGGETIRNAQLRIADMEMPIASPVYAVEMILGADFLRAHRLLAAYSQRKLYFTYEGGAVFQVVRPIDEGEGPQ